MLKLYILFAAYQTLQTAAFKHQRLALRPYSHSISLLSGPMTHGVKKENLPSKMCVTCNRPFTWRKKWERCWDEVTTCSKGCNAKRRALAKKEGRELPDDDVSDDEEDVPKNVPKNTDSKRGGIPMKMENSSSQKAEEVDVEVPKKIENVTNEGEKEDDNINEEKQDNDDDTDDENGKGKTEKKISRKKLQKLKMKEVVAEAAGYTEIKDTKNTKNTKKDAVGERTKTCAVCNGEDVLLFRCQWDASKQWRFVCTYSTCQL